MSDDLEYLASKHDAADAESEQPAIESEPESLTVEASDDAGNLAGFAVASINGLLSLLEPRLDLKSREEEACVEVGPVVEKYELHHGGAGEAFAYKPELKAGFFLGRYIKSIITQWKHWRERDRKNDGDKRENNTTEQAHSVFSQERLWKESDSQEARADQGKRGESDSVG